MKIETTFSCGDTAWCLDGDAGVRLLTVGQVRVEITDTPGVNGGCVHPGCSVPFDNFKPKQHRLESYMMVETGIGGGQVYMLGEHVFAVKDDADAAMLEWQRKYRPTQHKTEAA